MSDQAKKIIDLLKKLTENRFYGKLELKFREGKITHVTKEESIKMD